MAGVRDLHIFHILFCLMNLPIFGLPTWSKWPMALVEGSTLNCWFDDDSAVIERVGP